MPEDSTHAVDLLLWLIIVVLFSAYTKNMQETTSRLGRTLFGTEEGSGTGVQDAITPKWQTRNNIIMIVGLGLYALVCFWVLVWYLAIVLWLVTFLLLIPLVARLFMPRPMSPHYVERIVKGLEGRRAQYLEAEDSVRVGAIDELIQRIQGYRDESTPHAR